MVDVALRNARILHQNNKEGSDSSYSLLAFRREVVNAVLLRYSSQNPKKSNLSRIAIKDVQCDVRLDNARKADFLYVKNDVSKLVAFIFSVI